MAEPQIGDTVLYRTVAAGEVWPAVLLHRVPPDAWRLQVFDGTPVTVVVARRGDRPGEWLPRDEPHCPTDHADSHGEPPERCPAEASQRGQHIRCDLPTGHAGAQHSNREHQLVWSGLSGPAQQPVDAPGYVDALVRALPGADARAERRGGQWVVSILVAGFAAYRVECLPTGYDLLDVGRQFYLASKVDLDTVVRQIAEELART